LLYFYLLFKFISYLKIIPKNYSCNWINN